MKPEELRQTIRDHFAADLQVAAVYLFGSHARGTARRDSDVDVGVLFKEAPASTLTGQPFGVEAALSERLGTSVQVVVMNTAPVDLIQRILRDGEILIEPDRSKRIAFEVRARNSADAARWMPPAVNWRSSELGSL